MTIPRARKDHPARSGRPTTLHLSAGLIAATSLALTLITTAQDDPEPATDHTRAASQVMAPIIPTATTSRIRQRAQTWLTAWHDAPVPYLSSTDPNTWFQGYRRDCSGYVSMILGLPGPGLTTSGLADTTVSVPIAKDDLRLGDLMINPGAGADGHVVLFDHWTDETRRHYVGYDLSGSRGTRHRVLPYPYTDGYPMSPHRYRGTQQTATSTTTHLTLAGTTTLHNATTPPNTWQTLPTPPATPVTDVATATTSTTTHVAALAGGRPWYLQATGTAPGRWTPITDEAGTLPAVTALTMTVLDGDVHLLAVHAGHLSHTVRHPDGNWQVWQDLPTTNIPDVPATVTAATITAVDRELHVAAVRDGTLTHTRRNADGIWQPWQDLPAATATTGTATGSGPVTALASAAWEGQLHLVVVRGGTVLALQREETALWTPATVLHPAGAPRDVTDVAIAATSGRLDAVALGAGGPVGITRSQDDTWGAWSQLSRLPRAAADRGRAGVVSLSAG